MGPEEVWEKFIILGEVLNRTLKAYGEVVQTRCETRECKCPVPIWVRCTHNEQGVPENYKDCSEVVHTRGRTGKFQSPI